MLPARNHVPTPSRDHAPYSDGSAPSQTGSQYSEYAKKKGTTTTDSHCKGIGIRWHSNQTTAAEARAIRRAPDPRDKDSSTAFIRSPPHRIPLRLILLIQPRLQRRKIIRQRARIHLPLTGQRRQRLLPRLALPQRQHLVQPLPCHLIIVN